MMAIDIMSAFHTYSKFFALMGNYIFVYYK